MSADAFGLRVARGFRVSLYADADLANDIYAMTLDASGNVVVTGEGYIKTLHDRNGDGVADSATLFAATRTGGMGLCFDGNDLYFCGDGFLSRYRDADGDGQADGEPEYLLHLDFSEHGGHAMRKGPDGWWYVIAGNETRFTSRHTSLPSSPIRQIEGGALLRLPPDGQGAEAIAHGLRNAYDFDFNWLGDIFTYDSDVESDFFLPWYSPTRFYHVGYAGHHGWRLEGWRRSWARPGYYADTVPPLYEVGRGSPTGVTCYRHYQFPPRFRNGIFALDWTFGRVLFLPLEPSGASYRATPEVFLESTGTQGFDPTDIVVTPDGALLISIGGRKTRGAVYRVDYVGDASMAAAAANWRTRVRSDLEAVLTAPQPLDAWSRAYWVPLAMRLGPAPFAEVVANNQMAPDLRVRAVEILTELNGGLQAGPALAGAQAKSPFVRARVAWSLGRTPTSNYESILSLLARDSEAVVRRCALEAMADHAAVLDKATVQQALAANLGHPEKRVRLGAARLATTLPELAWNALWNQQSKGLPQARLTLALALLWRSGPEGVNQAAIDAALSVLAQDKLTDHRLQAVRLIILALGDYHLHEPSVEVYTAYEPALPLTGKEALSARIRGAVRPLLPSGDFWVDVEATRLLAMLEDADAELPGKLLASCTDKTSPTADFHFLTVLSRTKGTISTNALPTLAAAILRLDRKLEGQEQRPKQNWSTRLAEVVQALLRREPRLADALLQQPNFASPGHIAIAASFPADHYLAAARRFLAAVEVNPRFGWSGPLLDLICSLPAEEFQPVLRRQWSNLALRDEILLKLAEKPVAADRDRFIVGLTSPQPKVARVSLAALQQLPTPDGPRKALVPALRLLLRLETEPAEGGARGQLVALVNAESGRSFNVHEQGADATSLKRAYQPIFDWFTVQYPALAGQLKTEDQPDEAQWTAILKRVAWERGDASRGEKLFVERGCQVCHTAPTPLGPDLGGVTGRFSIPDLFYSIIYPSREVAPAYRTTSFQMRNGESYTGLVAFESADGVIVQTGATTTVRLNESEIVSRQPSTLSLMPSGLLAGLQPVDLGDLFAYLRTLQPKRGQ